MPHAPGVPNSPGGAPNSAGGASPKRAKKRRPNRPGPRRSMKDLAVDQYTALKNVSLDDLQDGTILPFSITDLRDAGGPTTKGAGADKPSGLPRYINVVGQSYLCSICNAKCSSLTVVDNHVLGKRHFVMVLAGALKKNRKSLREDKGGIQVSVLPMEGLTVNDDNDIELVLSSNGKGCSGKWNKIMFQLKNSSEFSVTLHRCDLLQLLFRHLFALKGNVTRVIPPGEGIEITLKSRVTWQGSYTTRIAFFLTRTDDPQYRIHIVHTVSVRFNMADLSMADLKPKAPYRRPPRVAVNNYSVMVEDGQRLEESNSSDRLERALPLPLYRIPHDLKSAVNHGLKKDPLDDNGYVAKLCDLLAENLDDKNYAKKFSSLLYIEELQMEVDIRKYDLKSVQLEGYSKNKKLLKLRVPGLSENRPSVLRGDHILVRKIDAEGKPENLEYRGYVHEVLLNEICLMFSANFHKTWIQSMKFDVRFVLNRLCQRLQHRSVELALENSLSPMLFAKVDAVCKLPVLQPLNTNIKFYDRLVEGNNEQALAVRHILSGSSRPAPFLIFGPPGTGKTVTIVEAMKQVVKCFPYSHLLACCPSNNSADYLTQRLLEHVPRKSVIRLNAACRSRSAIPDNILDVCNYHRLTHEVEFPSVKDLMEYQIIVCTLITAGRLVSANFSQGHFTHIFIDEAGQASEPECIIPIAGIFESDLLVKDGGQIVLAGDPEQLGPVLRSPWAVKYGLGTSLLERLMKQVDVYRRCGDVDEPSYNDNLLVKLVRNYRSHPAILQVPNEIFYDNELQVHADRDLRESLCRWEGVCRQGFPIIFHGIVGKEEREERSPSYFNRDEISVISDYIERLVRTSGGVKVKESDIGIITPYRKQVEKFKQLCGNKKWKEMKVGSVEEFQGLERRVIIISTVRSSADQLASDFHFKLGFLKNPKRFNVAITRSMALLIVVGNPFILITDEHWGRMLRYCKDNGAYTGCDFDPDSSGGDDDGFNDVAQQFNKLELNASTMSPADDPAKISQMTQEIDPQWIGTDRI